MKKPGRNDPCPCGSGKKYKHCCLLNPTAPAINLGMPPLETTIWNPPALPPDQFMFDDDESWDDYLADLPPLDAAYEIAQEGWLEPDDTRLEIAKEALALSPDCIEAYLLWASAVRTPEEALSLYDQALAAAEHELGIDWETQHPRRLWMDTPAIEAAHDARRDRGLALLALGRTEEGLDLLQKALTADPDDIGGARFDVLRELLRQGREREAIDLLNQMPDQFGAIGLYMRALLKFRDRGDTFWPRRALVSALAYDPVTASTLADAEPNPKQLDPATLLAFGAGDDGSAEFLKPFWEQTPGALDWLERIFDAGPDAHLDALPRGDGPALNLALSDAEGYIHCPRCHRKTKQHKRDIVILFEPDHVDLAQMTCRICGDCNILCLLARDVIKVADQQAQHLGLNRVEHDFVTIGVIDPAFHHQQFASDEERSAAMGEYLHGWSDEIAPTSELDPQSLGALQELDEILDLARATGLLDVIATNPLASQRPKKKKRPKRR